MFLKNYFTPILCKATPLLLFLGYCLILSNFACNSKKSPPSTKPSSPEIMDVHSYAKPSEAVVQHISLDLSVNFEKKVLSGTSTLTIKTSADAKKVFLDTKGLEIKSVQSAEGPCKFVVHPEDTVLGQALEIDITPTTKSVTVSYATTAHAEAVQWLAPSQTAGKIYPFLFTQGEAILTRTWIPCQDSPGIRVTYDATIHTPKELMALMSADGNATAKNDSGIYKFEMKQAIAPYLIALAVGDVAFKAIDTRTGVYAEPSLLDKSANEFAEMGSMVSAASKLYGEYAWGRYDLIVLPPSFPFGGMENPKLTFATPTILAGDRSLTNLVAHELAHSWSGNTVTNATWDDFWLNEGFTVYFERRIMEALQGKDYADMLAVLGLQDVKETVASFGNNSPATCLKLNLKGVNPDDGMNDIAYEKGYLLLRTIEDKVGRAAWDEFLIGYFKRNAFTSITTEEFLIQLDEQLLKKNNSEALLAEVKKWIYEPGLPTNYPTTKSSRFEAVDAISAQFAKSSSLPKSTTDKWSTHEWLHFLRGLPESTSLTQMEKLDAEHHLSASTNSEIQFAWYMLAVAHNYKPAFANMEKFLIVTGRRKFLTPLYALIKEKQSNEASLSIYKKARNNYHFVATNTMDALLGWK